jgi:hypothetical protein
MRSDRIGYAGGSTMTDDRERARDLARQARARRAAEAPPLTVREKERIEAAEHAARVVRLAVPAVIPGTMLRCIGYDAELGAPAWLVEHIAKRPRRDREEPLQSVPNQEPPRRLSGRGHGTEGGNLRRAAEATRCGSLRSSPELASSVHPKPRGT